MSKAKISKIGNSAGVILSRDILDELGLKVGTPVVITVDTLKKILVIGRASRAKKSPIDPNFSRRVEDFIRKYEPALKELAR